MKKIYLNESKIRSIVENALRRFLGDPNGKPLIPDCDYHDEDEDEDDDENTEWEYDGRTWYRNNSFGGKG